MVNAILKPNWGGLRIFSMMRIASVLSTLKRPLAGAALLLMAGCAGGQAADVQDGAAADVAAVKSAASVDSFTTVGKPTKTIETPWGPREVYDPAQDEDVRAAFFNIYEDGRYIFGNFDQGTFVGLLPGVSPGQDYQTVFAARRTIIYDFMRLGCLSPLRIPTHNRRESIDMTCQDRSMQGDPKLSTCEEKSATVNVLFSGSKYRIWNETDKAKFFSATPWAEGRQISATSFGHPYNPMNLENSSYISDVNFTDVDQAMNELFKQKCTKWK